MAIVRLSSKGQIVIPAEIRKYFKLDEGDRLLIEKKNRDIVIKPVAKLSRLKGIDKGAWMDTSNEINKMREEWDKEFE